MNHILKPIRKSILTFLLFIFTGLMGQTVFNPVTGKTWMDRNLGASQVATSSTDADAFGSLFQWGRDADGHESRTSTTTTTLSNTDTPNHPYFILGDPDWRSPQNDSLWQGIQGINNPCPDGFRLPTEAEFEEERLSWNSNNAAGAFASPLKLTLSGARSRISGQIGNVGTFAGYRTSTITGTTSRVLGIGINDSFIGNRERGDGNCVRCIQDETALGAMNHKPMPDAPIILSKNYPNPFNPVTTITYTISETMLVKIIIYDMMGRKVKSLVDEFQNLGNHSVVWNATNHEEKPVGAGTYFYQISAGKFLKTEKMILLK